MNVKEEYICRLCLKVTENDFQIIDETVRNKFEYLLLRMNLDINKDPIICKECVEVMEKCYNFKSVCISTKELSIPIGQNIEKFDLKDVYKDGKDIETVDDYFICRFCSNQLSASKLVLFDTLMNDVKFAEMFPLVMSEMDFDFIKNTIICTSCKQDLKCYIKFVDKLLKVEQKISKYIQTEGIPSSGQVKLSEILHYLYKNISDSDYTQIRAMKQEEDILEDTSGVNFKVYDSLIKDEVLDIKDEEFFVSEIDCETLSDMPVYEFNTPCRSSIKDSSFTHTMADCTNCVYDTIQDCRINCLQSNMVSLDTGIGKTYQVKCLSEVQIFKCTVCTYETKRKHVLKKHMLIHKDITEVNMYTCSTCTYKSKHRDDLKSHVLVHKDITEVKMHKCAICTYETKYKNVLKKHILIHKEITEVEMYACSTCTYKSKHKGDLKSHMLVHKDITEVKMHKCVTCTFETKYKNVLKKHMLVHKAITEVEMYTCSMCTYKTKRKGDLKGHMLSHKDITEVEMYKCSICTYQTRYKNYLKRHILNHKDFTEVKTYTCSMCVYETKCKGNLKSHMLIHKDITEVEMYKCSMCTYETKYKGGLKRHTLTHRGILLGH